MLTPKQLDTVSYDDFNIAQYRIYITEPGSDQVIFENPEINLQLATEFVVTVRELNGIFSNILNLDIVTNSAGVATYSHIYANCQ
ncbi:hypothetical protein [Paraglaciecola sp. L3A3]|uniref:hypothetical protein n=1 Tax=Paraglaciecola sp. L3A3 TaxID=2686358 RepID=UPI00131B37B9|nr:hypothetical protein [Paraglaciecola sp. L3A3]